MPSPSVSVTEGAANVARIPSSAATNNATLVKATPGTLRQIIAYNSTAAVIYLKIFNKATAPDPAADVPLLTLVIPPTGGFVGDASAQFTAGIGIALVTGAADLNNTAVGAAAILGLNVLYD